MFEFNPDGSLKLPDQIINQKKENEQRFKTQRCIHIRKEVINFTAPKKCMLRIRLSDVISDNRFMQTTYEYFRNSSSVPSKFSKISEKEFDVEIGTDFRRCTDCMSLINRYREFLDGNVIEEKGSCTFQGRSSNFCEEDCFE